MDEIKESFPEESIASSHRQREIYEIQVSMRQKCPKAGMLHAQYRYRMEVRRKKQGKEVREKRRGEKCKKKKRKREKI
jgi:hypothetical protein